MMPIIFEPPAASLTGSSAVHSKLTTSPPVEFQKWENFIQKKESDTNWYAKVTKALLAFYDQLRKIFYYITLQNESIGTSRRRTQPFTGRGGAPKFFLNWLTFAL